MEDELEEESISIAHLIYFPALDIYVRDDIVKQHVSVLSYTGKEYLRKLFDNPEGCRMRSMLVTTDQFGVVDVDIIDCILRDWCWCSS